MDKFRRMEDEMSRFEAEIAGQSMMNAYGPTYIPGFGNIPPPPQPPLLVPHQVGKKIFNTQSVITAQPAVVSAKPTIYHAPAQKTVTQATASTTSTQQQQAAVDFLALQSEVEKKLKKLKNEKVSAELAISQGKASSALQSFGPEDYKRRGSKNRKLIRTAGGQTWEDSSLADWAEDDFRIFCGDLGLKL
ncbi:hypothetical protein GWI33_009274 [Rhynchophorus ferrugineus]|uniref:Uncharacterized protein n=1 Tax=Rhynchophorus ferrugineus TaxID=354439 RepID=A0A834IAT2_RHYFE|nr:hypothetical protein GWI33_009274 [Rhynchophorus ferrugineus]